jgi:hypothetical protein
MLVRPRIGLRCRRLQTRLVRDGSFSHFLLNSSVPQIFGHFGQFGSPDSELFDNFRFDRSLLQLATSPRHPQKTARVSH